MLKNGETAPATEFVLGDRCAWHGCGKGVESDRFVCRNHDSKVPLLLKAVVDAALAARKYGSRPTGDAADKVLIAVGEYLLLQHATRD